MLPLLAVTGLVFSQCIEMQFCVQTDGEEKIWKSVILERKALAQHSHLSYPLWIIALKQCL